MGQGGRWPDDLHPVALLGLLVRRDPLTVERGIVPWVQTVAAGVGIGHARRGSARSRRSGC